MLAVLVVTLLSFAVAPAQAHQPFFEEQDIEATRPWEVRDPTISTAVYATLDRADDVDYYTFTGRRGQRVVLEMTIPQIAGQELFAPEMALLGPALPPADLPARVMRQAGGGALAIPALTGTAATFNEPFSGTSYWKRQRQVVTLPADGRFVVAVWHSGGEAGRYVFVIGDKERPGGEPAFSRKLRAYWTAVPPPVSAPVSADAADESRGCGGY
jgi:hypothetical protein